VTAHRCHAVCCGRECPPRLLMCPACWRTVPPALGALVVAAFDPRQCRAGADRPLPSGPWMLAADACIAAAAQRSGRFVRGRWLRRAMDYALARCGSDAEARGAAERVAAAAPPDLAEALRRAWFGRPGDAAEAAWVAADARAREALGVRWATRRAWLEAGDAPATLVSIWRLHDARDEAAAGEDQWRRAEDALRALAWARPGEGWVLAPARGSR
jgi:hypothetical protein